MNTRRFDGRDAALRGPATVEAKFEQRGERVTGQRVTGDQPRWVATVAATKDDPARPAVFVPATVVPRIRIVDKPEIITRRVNAAHIRVHH